MIGTWVISSGFALGILGSLHCMGMCGPLVLMAQGPSLKRGWSAFWMSTLPYHGGRILVYTLMAAAVGGILDAATLPSWQGPISLVSGLLLILVYALGFAPSFRLGTQLSQWANLQFAKQRPGSMWVAGALNGLLPCGLSLAALVAASSQGTALGAAWFMLGFGLGTSPALIALVGLGASMPEGLRRMARRVAPYTVLVVGLLLLLRGANLGIPLLSPKWDSMHMQTNGTQSSHGPPCCH